MAIAPDGPGQLVKVRGGGIGPGLPGSLGAALARPDQKVVGMCSDGAAMYSITALWTAAHHRIPVTYVMLGNRAYRILKLNMVEYLGPQAAKDREFVGDGPARSGAALRPDGRGDGRARATASSAPKTWRQCCAKRSATRAARSWWTCRWSRRCRARRCFALGLLLARRCHPEARNEPKDLPSRLER